MSDYRVLAVYCTVLILCPGACSFTYCSWSSVYSSHLLLTVVCCVCLSISVSLYICLSVWLSTDLGFEHRVFSQFTILFKLPALLTYNNPGFQSSKCGEYKPIIVSYTLFLSLITASFSYNLVSSLITPCYANNLFSNRFSSLITASLTASYFLLYPLIFSYSLFFSIITSSFLL